VTGAIPQTRPCGLGDDARDLLVRFCIDDPRLHVRSGAGSQTSLDARTLALVRLGALVAMAAPARSMRAGLDDTITAGASVEEVVAVLDGIADVVGMPRVVAAAPRVASVFGYADDLLPDDDLLADDDH